MSEDSANDTNPYAPPTAIGNPISDWAPRSTTVVVLVSIAAICYFVFTWLLLSSGGDDYQGGRMFVFNVPVVLLWLLAVVSLRRFALVAGLATAAVQTVITVGMLYTGIGDAEVVVAINVGIIAAIFFLVWLSQRSTRVAKGSEH